MKRAFYDGSYRHARVEGSGLHESTSGHNRLFGVVATPHGYVRVIGITRGFVDENEWGALTRLWFIHNGTFYDRTYRGVLTRRGAVRAAGRFARHIMRRKGK